MFRQSQLRGGLGHTHAHIIFGRHRCTTAIDLAIYIYIYIRIYITLLRSDSQTTVPGGYGAPSVWECDQFEISNVKIEPYIERIRKDFLNSI